MKWSIPLVVAVLLLAPMARSSEADVVDDFWQATRERLAREPVEADVEPVVEALPFRKFKVTLRSLDGARIRAWLAIPVQGEAPAKPWPVIVTPPGYSGRQAGVLLGECQRGYAVLQVFPRGQGDSAELSPIKGEKLTSQLDQPEGAYYQGAYADVIRGIDFVTSREDLDHDRIAMVGGSQGGGMALAVAALDPRVKAVVAHVPFLCDMPLAAQTPKSLVKQLLDRAGRNDEAALRTLGYFDPATLAPRVRVPVLMSAGGNDEVCPANTIQSVYERLPGRKTLKVYPDLPHTSCLDFYNLTWSWLDLNFRGATQEN
jgi:cephalosporin-C deacetylase